MLGGLKEIQTLIFSLQSARDFIDTYHDCLFKEACNLASRVDTTVKHPSTCERQMHWGNNPANNTSDYFKFNV